MIDVSGTFDNQMKKTNGVTKASSKILTIAIDLKGNGIYMVFATPIDVFIWASNVPLPSIIMPRSLSTLV